MVQYTEGPAGGRRHVRAQERQLVFCRGSGAVTDNINYSDKPSAKQYKDYNRDGSFRWDVRQVAIDIFKKRIGFDPKDVDYVTITIGGNDLGFVNVINEAA